ncbi:MAG: roadblock/LC7 domain-containing protein [Streptomycetaceae bacterium]|nr:roadblock/LC7 domain-containing protein [Streptomycetaceae bacterium]
MEWLLDTFVSKVPGVTHALLVSRDGLTLLASGMDKDWADTMAATVSGHASLAQGTPGPKGGRLPAQQIMIEREDCLFFIMSSGTGQRSAFTSQPGTCQGTVDTVLGVLAEPDADGGTVGYEMGRLITAFAQHMHTPIRQAPYDTAPAVGPHTGAW